MSTSGSTLYPLERESPYRGLTPYTESDAAYFFGRTTEIATVTASLAVARLTIFYGPTGVGKTSLLRAGVLHQLQQQASQNAASNGCPEIIPIYFNRWQHNPLAGLLQAISDTMQPYLAKVKVANDGDVPDLVPAGDSESLACLTTQLRTWSAATASDLLIVLDQFEEYFLYQPNADANYRFAQSLALAINSPNLHANFILSLREDALARLDCFKDQIAFLLNNRLSMTHLRRIQGCEAVTRPLAQYNLDHGVAYAIEPGLTETVLDQVERGKVSLTRQGASVSTAEAGFIETPYLQLVLTRIWQEELAHQSTLLRKQTLVELGGAETIVATYLDHTMAELSAEQQAIAAHFFDHLVTLGGAKIALSLDELVRYAQAPIAVVEMLLQQLQDKRLVRGVSTLTGTLQYEIFHDVLAQAVVAWQRRYQQAQEEAARLKGVQAERADAEARATEATARAALEERARQEAQRSAESERRNSQRLRWLLGIMALLVCAVGTLAFLAWGAQKSATEQANRALSGELAAQSIMVSESEPELGILFALEAISILQTQPAEDALRRSLLASYLITDLPHDQTVMDVRFSPDGKQILSGPEEEQIHLWDGDTYRLMGQLTGEYGPTVRLDYDPKGSKIASAHEDGKVQLWDAHTLTLLHTLSGHSQLIWDVDFSPEGRRVASGSQDGTVIVWDTISGHSMQTLPVNSEVYGVAFNRDGRLLATVSEDGVARVWDLATETIIFSKTQYSRAGPAALYGVAFSPIEDLLAVSGKDRAITLWQPGNAQESPRELRGQHTATVRSLTFSTDGKRLLSADLAGVGIVWDVSNLNGITEMKRLKGHTDEIYNAVFDPDGIRVATASYDQSVKLWLAAAHHGRIYDLAFDPNHKERLVTASADGTARIWSFVDGRLTLLHTLVHGAEVRQAVFSPDGKQIATAGQDKSVKLWNADTGQWLRTLLGHSNLVKSVAFSHNGMYIATASYDGQAGLWYAQSGQRIRFLREGGEIMNDVAFSADDRLLATASDDNVVRLWRVDNGERITVITGHSAPVERVAFSPNGSTLATSSSDGTARLWSPDNATAIYTFTEHTNQIFGLAYDFTGQRLATAGMDGRIVMHDLVTGQPIQELPAKGALYGVAFSPDGKYILSVGQNDDIGIQALAVEDLVAQARRRLTRGWRLEECKQYLGVEECPDITAQ